MEQSNKISDRSAQFKFNTVLEVVSGDRSISEVAAEKDLPSDLISEWVDYFHDAGSELFDQESESRPIGHGVKSLLEKYPEMVFVLDEDLTIERVNQAFLETLDFAEEDLLGVSVEAIIDSEDLSELSKQELLKKAESSRMELNLRKSSGDLIPVALSISRSFDEYTPDALICFASDISNLRETQEKLQLEKDRFQAIYNKAPVGLWEQDMSQAREYVMQLKRQASTDLESFLEENPEELREIAARIETLSVNQQLLDILGAQDQDHLLQNLNNVFTDETYEVFMDEMVKFFQEGETSYRNEVTVQTVDGSPRTVLFSLNQPDVPGESWSWVFVTYRDITERKRMQRELAKNEERFRQLAENINSIFWIEDITSGENLYISPAVEEVTGQPRRKFVRDPDAFLDIIHPEDKERVRDAIETSREHDFQSPGEYEIEYRIKRPDGEVRWLHDRAYPVHDEQGNVYRVAGIAEDITDRKQMEKRLQRSVEEKETLLQEIHHRVKNNMQIISSLLRLQSYQVDDEDARGEFLDCQQRVNSMVMVHEKLYQSDQISDIDISDYFDQLIEGIVTSQSKQEPPQVELEVDERLNLDLDQTIACGLIINELVTNALEHAFDGEGTHPEIELAFRRDGENAVLTVSDNGSGPPEDLDAPSSDSLGLQLLESLTDSQLDGDYDIRDENGMTVEITFPL
ncbi:MAG: PAS domain S-box protein [bacterium]